MRFVNHDRVKASGSISYREYHNQYRLPEQFDMENLLLKRKHFALACEPGKSKTYPVIYATRMVDKMLNGEAKVLILSDAGTIKDMWQAEIVPQGILPKRHLLLSDRTAAGGVIKPKRKGGKSTITGLTAELINAQFDVLIVDECQSLRSGVTRGKSNFAKVVWQIAKKTPYVFGLTGTLAGNNNIEPFCVLHALHIAGCGDIECGRFERSMCIREMTYGPFGQFMKPVDLNEAGEDFMEEAYEKGVYFWGYDENDDMPPFTPIFKDFKVEPTKYYKDALEGILQCGDYENTVTKAAALQKAQQALNGYVYYGKGKNRQTWKIPDFHNPKLDYVESEIKIRKNLIVAYRFQEDYNTITQRLDAIGVKHCTKIQEFKRRAEAGEKLVLVLQAMRGKAVNLQVCQDIIYYTCDFSFINYKQLIHRTWRRGQAFECRVTFLCNEPGDKAKVEFKIWQSMRKKQSIHDTLMSIKGGDE